MGVKDNLTFTPIKNKKMTTITIINGPNMNLLGKRQKNIYGTKSLKTIIHNLYHEFKNKAIIKHFQSNSEEQLIKKIHTTQSKYIILNMAGFSYNNIAILDALLAKNTKFLEVHMSNIFNRNKFRRKSIFSKYAMGVLIGLGDKVYKTAVYYLTS
ncbi:3-dehydroquinate dehydratase [Candidatus Vidania fulgoroideae]|uniref:3-dehydroquinate dehydratase n=1 Tax=Candidatus Vidania fulgoroideorum TaxID=881286 RepID=A0A975AEH2_9PROT|nr:3-dehydroquinate dehydratase [Candidatus Vidania fulgoroideae]